jgi:UDP-N-acetylglucosamine 2-epimerase (non-hydrolysing)
MKIILVVGARPNFMKIAPIIDAIKEHNRTSDRPLEYRLVHTGQHYDEKMSKLFFDDLAIPKPDIDLGVGSASHAEQTAEIIKKFEKVCLQERPTHVLVVGDVNSTIACALVASKLNIKIIHVEAGLRSFDRSMPEEINRVLTDAISDSLFITEKSAEENLLKEGVAKDKIFFVGNVMIDTLFKHLQKARESSVLDRLGLREGTAACSSYGLLTLHRPSNVDDEKIFKNILEALVEIAKTVPIIFPVHPRTLGRIKEFNLEGHFAQYPVRKNSSPAIYCVEPQGYLDFLSLTSNARLVLTDSGGIQEETTVLGVPCVTLRENTERPVTVTDGTNILAGMRKSDIVKAAASILKEGPGSPAQKPVPPLWDGNAAKRIVEAMARMS